MLCALLFHSLIKLNWFLVHLTFLRIRKWGMRQHAPFTPINSVKVVSQFKEQPLILLSVTSTASKHFKTLKSRVIPYLLLSLYLIYQSLFIPYLLFMQVDCKLQPLQ